MLTMKRGALYGAALTIGILIGLPAMPGSGFVPAAQAGVIDDIVGAGRAVGGAVKDAGKRIGHDARNTGKIIGRNAKDWGTSVGAGVKDIGVGFYDHVICNIPATNCRFNPPGATPLPPKPDAPRVSARPGRNPDAARVRARPGQSGNALAFGGHGNGVGVITDPVPRRAVRIRDDRPGAKVTRVGARPGKPVTKPILPPRIRDARPGANKLRVRARPGLKPF